MLIVPHYFGAPILNEAAENHDLKKKIPRAKNKKVDLSMEPQNNRALNINNEDK